MKIIRGTHKKTNKYLEMRYSQRDSGQVRVIGRHLKRLNRYWKDALFGSIHLGGEVIQGQGIKVKIKSIYEKRLIVKGKGRIR